MVRALLAVALTCVLAMACKGASAPSPTPLPTQPPTPSPLPLPTPTPEATPPRTIAGSTAIAHPSERVPAPIFRLTLFTSEEISLSTFQGKVIVLNFWASWCVPCRSEMPQFERAWRTWQDQGVVILGVATGDHRENALAFAQQVGVTYPLGLDTDGQIAVAYRVTGLPTTYFIDREGRVARRIVGYVNEGYLRFVLSTLVQEQSP